MKLFARLQHSKDAWFLLIVSFVFFLLRLPSLFEPYWYGDEGIYQVLGAGMRAGRLLYRDIWDNKPPLLYIIYALFGSDQFTIRFVSLLFGLTCVGVFFLLAKKLFKEKTIIYIATGVFACLFGLPLLEGNIANAENFMMLPILVAGLLTVGFAQKQKEKTLFYIGLLLSLAFLFKVVAIFDFTAFSLFLFFVFHPKHNKISTTIYMLLPLITAFFLPIALTGLFFFFAGAFGDFFDAAFRQNVGYVGYGNTFIVAQGFLYLKLFLLGMLTLYLFCKRHVFSSSQLFIILWFGFSLFNAFFSQRPYTHYLLVLLPSFVLFGGMAFSREEENAERKIIRAGKVVLLIVLLLLIKNFWLYTKTTGYYQNFIDFISTKKSVFAYQKFFDSKTPWDYALASYLTLHMAKNETIFLWGNNAQIYTLTHTLPPGRYTVAYHIRSSDKTLNETFTALQKTKPKFIVIMAEEQTVPYSFPGYIQKFTIDKAIIYERISAK